MAHTNEQKTALAAKVAEIVQRVGKAKTWGEAVKWFDGLNSDVFSTDGLDKFALKEVDVSGFKMVQITLAVDEATGEAEVLAVEPLEAEVAAESAKMDDEEEEDEEAEAKGGKMARIIDGKMHTERKGQSPGTAARMSAARKYNKTVANGGTIRTCMGRQSAVFGDYDQAEAFGAWCRVSATDMGAGKAYAYSQRANDLAILQKTGTTTDNSNAGGFVPPEFINELIDNLDNFGVAPRVCNFRSVSTDAPYLNKHTADHTTYLQGAEGSSITASDATISQVQLSLRTIATLGKFSQQLWDDAAMGIGEWFAMSSTRSQAKAIDTEFFNGTQWNTGDGLDNKVGANTTKDTATSSSILSEVTIDDITDCLALLQGEAIASGDLAIVCSPQVWQGVFSRFVLNTGMSNLSGGDRREDLGGGVRGSDVREFDGIPVYLANVMYEAVAADINLWFAGDFNAGTVAARRKDIEIAFSDQEEFSKYNTIGRTTQRCWWNHHGVNNTANGSQVVKAIL